MDKEMENDKTQSKNWRFSEFFRNTPCVRSSLITGIAGGMASGMALFVYSKHIKRSCDLAVASFALISCGSWGYCSYNRRKQKENIELVIESLKKKNKENKDLIENHVKNKNNDNSIEANNT